MIEVNKMALHTPTLFQELKLLLTSTLELLGRSALQLHLEVARKDVFFVRIYCDNKSHPSNVILDS